jgi:hypothetical protein
MRVNQGSSAAAIVELGRQKGYELVVCTDCNVILVDRKYFPRFGIADNSLDALYKLTCYQTWLFQGFDGTLHIAGQKKLIWSNIEIEEARIQMLPQEMRSFCDKLT